MWPEQNPRDEPRPHSYDLFDEGEQVVAEVSAEIENDRLVLRIGRTDFDGGVLCGHWRTLG